MDFLSGAQQPMPDDELDPIVVYIFAEDRKGQHVHEHLTRFNGVLQVDGYTGYRGLTKPDRPGGAITLAYCLAHARRQFFEVYRNRTRRWLPRRCSGSGWCIRSRNGSAV